jgi:MFS transporter, DHA1 family, tetracycline resistance protein
MSAQKKSPLVIIFFTVFLYLVGFGVIIPILPLLGKQFGASSTQVGLLMSIYSLMQFFFSPMWGRVSDRLGRRPVLLFCLLGEAGAYLLFAAARDLNMLFVARALAGFFGASISTASAYISDVTPANERSKGMALIGAAFGLGFMVGPALGGGLTWLAEGSTSFTLYFVSALCFLTFIFGYFFLQESLKEKANHSRESRWQNFIKYFKRPVVSQLLWIFFINTLAFATFEATLVLLMADRFAWGLGEVSFGFAYIGVISTVNQGLLVRRLLPRFGERNMLVFGISMMTLCFAAIPMATELWMMVIVMTVLPFAYAFMNPTLLGSLSVLSASNEQGAVLGSAQGLAALGRILGPAFGGFVYGAHQGSPFFFAALFTLIGSLIVFSVYPRLPESAKH